MWSEYDANSDDESMVCREKDEQANFGRRSIGRSGRNAETRRM